MLRIVPIKIHGRNHVIDTYALLDEGSDVSLCESSLLNELNIESCDKTFHITTVSDEGTTNHGKEVSLRISSIDGSADIDMTRV